MARIPTIPFKHVREFYARYQPDGRWFRPDTLRIFCARFPRVAYETNAGVLFIISEVNPSGDRRYTIYRQLFDGSITIVGELNSFPTRAAALAEIKRLRNQGG